LGGNLRSYVVDGWRVDTGVHALTYVQDGPLTRLMGKYVRSMPEILPYGSYFVRAPGKFGRFPWTIQDWLTFGILPFSDRLKFLSAMASAMALKKDEMLEKSLYDVLSKSGFSQAGWRFVDALAPFMSGRGAKETPAWRMLKGARYLEEEDRNLPALLRLQKLSKLVRYDGAYHQGYPKEGIGAVTNSIIKSMPKNVELKTGVEVSRINADGGRVKSVESSIGEHQADVVVYSGEALRMPALIDGLPKDYAESIKKLKQSKAITVWLGLSKPARELSYMGSEIWFAEGKPYWGMPTSNYNPRFAKEGGQLAGFTSFMEGDAKGEEKKLIETIYSAIPDVEDNVVFSHTQVCVPEKAAITVDARFPKVRTPIKWLYLVGTDADPRSMGATRAAFSVESLLDELRIN
jgi:phytoene dehydrogenase-like protein